MFGSIKLFRLLGFSITQPVVTSNEVLPEYQIFFDDLMKEYIANSNSEIKDILRIVGDRKGYRRLRDNNGNLLEMEIKKRFSELLDTHYGKYRAAIQRSQFYTDNAALRGLVRFIKGHGTWDIYFHQMHYITQDAIYYSLSKLNPEIHKINLFFIDYFNSRDGIQHEHQRVFNFSYTLRNPDFRGSLMAYVSNSLDALERSPLFILFCVPHNLTPFGEKHLPEIITIFAEKMQEYENANGITIARDCYRKPHVMNERKLKKIIHRLTREAENELRRGFGLPAVGDGWIQETILFYKVQAALPDIGVIHHGKAAWLGDQHLDIWMPGRKAAVEYNGQQHYEAIDFFGGVEGLKKRQELDERKAALCSDNGVRLFIVRFDEDMDAAVSRIQGSIQGYI
jgi:hypothetical protein